MTDWKAITSENFESLCYDILAQLGFKNLTWMGKTGGDRGRDILAEKTEAITDLKEIHRKYLIQCKKYRPSVSQLSAEFAWADAHNPDVLMLMISETLTADTDEWIEEMKPKIRYSVFVFDAKDFEDFFDRHTEIYAKHFGKERVTPKLAVILSLLDDKGKDVETIIQSTRLSENQVQPVLEELEQQAIVNVQGDSKNVYQLQHTISAFVEVANLLLANEQKHAFVLSRYMTSMNGPELIDYIGSRHHLSFEHEHREALSRLFSISPSALRAALFSSTQMYDVGYAHLRALKLDPISERKTMESFLTSFVMMLLQCTLSELQDMSSKKLFEDNKIEGYSLAVKIAMANPTNTILNLQSTAIMMILPTKPGSVIEAGQLVSATSPDLFLRIAGTLFNLELYDEAIRENEKAITALTDKKQLAIAWNNKGVCLLRLNRKDEATKCFHESLLNDPSLDQARANLEGLTTSEGSSP